MFQNCSKPSEIAEDLVMIALVYRRGHKAFTLHKNDLGVLYTASYVSVQEEAEEQPEPVHVELC